MVCSYQTQRLTFGLCVFLLAWWASLSHADTAQQSVANPAEIFSTLPPIGDIALSPDGSKAVVLKALADTYHVAVVDLETGKSNLVMAADPEKFSFNWCRFANPTRVLCSIRKYIRLRAGDIGGGARWYREGRTIATRLMAVDVDGGNVLQLVKSGVTELGRRLEWNPVRQDQIISWLENDADHVLIQLARDHRLYTSVYRLNINTNRMQRVRRHREGIWEWYADQRTGAIYNAAGYHRFKQQFQAHAVTDDGIVPIPLGGSDKDVPPKFVGYIKDGDSALMIMRNGRDKQALFEVSTKQGHILGTVFEDKEGRYDIVSAPLLTAEGRPVAIPVVGEKTIYHWFDKSLEKEY